MKASIVLITILFGSASFAEEPVGAYNSYGETPVVSFNGFSVTLQTSAAEEADPSSKTSAKADRICKRGGRAGAEYGSSKKVPQTDRVEHFYLCLN